MERLRRDGDQLWDGDLTVHLWGVTYGTFGPRPDGALFPESNRIADDFATMAAHGLQLVRLYTQPPPDLLEAAAANGLRVLVGLDFDDWRTESASPGRRATRNVLRRGYEAIERTMAICAGRPEVAAVLVGNEVPGDLVRVHGVLRVERALEALIDRVHEADPHMLVSYANYPTTEYLDPGNQDLLAFNVFLETRQQFARYLRHLRVIARDRPLAITEFGLAAARHGEKAQAELVEWQTREIRDAGVAAATAFSWTDEWVVGGSPVWGWGFGVTSQERAPKPALEVLRRAATLGPPLTAPPCPKVSVVVCAYNEERHIDACIRSVLASRYPDFELIICDDGSDDRTAEIARSHPVRVLELPHGGLSAARNAGLAAARGAIVAYLDADAEASPDWLHHLAAALESSDVVAVGGPNVPYTGRGFVEDAVARAPGNPREVLIGDDRAEHVAGCNMAFRRDALAAIGGFDVAYRVAGDDVDVGWKLLDRGGQIAFAPAASVRHHRRGTVRGYLRQQRGYGRAERMLQGRHPHRFNRIGQARWRGFVYGGLSLSRRLLAPVVYHGYAGTQPFQPVLDRPGERALATLTAVLPVLLVAGATATLVGALSGVAAVAGSGAALALGAVAAVAASAAVATDVPPLISRRTAFRALVGALTVAGPLARFWGRVRTRPLPGPYVRPTWGWAGDRSEWLRNVADGLGERGWRVRMGGETDPFDIEARRRLVRTRVTLAVLWDWEPRRAMSVRPSWPACLLTLAAWGAAAFAGTVPAATAGVLVAVLVGDSVRSRREVAVVSDEPTRRRNYDPAAGTAQPRQEPSFRALGSPAPRMAPGDARQRR